MGYKTWCTSIIGVVIFILIGLFAALYIIDPIGMWGTPVYAGLNNYKEKQSVFLDVYKPFELRRYKPDNIYIGTSRVYVGWYAEENAYNLGASSLSLPDMKAYLHYAYSQHLPQKVYIGLDLFQFSKSSMTEKREGFSVERLQNLERGGLKAVDEAFTVNMGMWEQLKPTVKASCNHKEDSPVFVRGYCVQRGDSTKVENNGYYDYLHSFYKTYTDFSFDPAALTCLQDILSEARANGVEVILFFNPIAVDLQAMQNICGVSDDYEKIKREVARMHPVYDFAWCSPLTLDREDNWIDGSHYHRRTGEKLKSVINNQMDESICKILTVDSVDEALKAEREKYQVWEGKNEKYIAELTLLAPEKIKEGSLVEFLGF
ncbi:hypothetical protein FZ041_06060 [Selenomonas caprae]|uniref:Uncharacterized protein n=1 Tax=Selenomonas caprae TaxID=2606905 RepID=A0A5D6WLX7_9FIRM|nr:hypothetical protein [Selenomonas caprae]TYZ29106.1 hypothetical protein FZ041_06060 [Selenomonas caprae]